MTAKLNPTNDANSLTMPSDSLIPGSIPYGATLRIGWRNLARSRRRTLLTASTVAFAVFLLQALMAFLIGIEQQSFDNLINYQTAHAKLYAEGYFDNRDDQPLDYTLSTFDEIERLLVSVSGVAATTERIVFSAQLSDGIDQVASFGTGIRISGSDADVFRLEEAVVEGSYLVPNEEGMLLGSGLADFFDVSPGDFLTILTKTRDGAYEALDLSIVGILGTGNPLIDRSSFLVPLTTAQQMLDLEGEATEIAVRFNAMARESATLSGIRRVVGELNGVEVKGWREIEEDFMALVTLKRTAQGIFLSIFVIMAIVGITNTIVMATYERTREIGTLMAMGFRGAGIRRLFLIEGALTGFLGGGIGTVFAVLLVGYFASTGIDISALYGDMDVGYPVKDMLYPSMSPVLFFMSWFLTGVLAALASLYPAYRASILRPVNALRHV